VPLSLLVLGDARHVDLTAAEPRVIREGAVTLSETLSRLERA